jgi:hypothetical protein
MDEVYETFTFNTSGDSSEEVINGEPYVVVPVVMLTEDVHNGSKGKLYYPADELKASPSSWDKLPITAGHPKKDGKSVLANNEEGLKEFGIGFLENTLWDGKLRTKAKYNKAKADKADPRIIPAIKSGKPVEVSTGLLMKIENKKGKFNGREYDGIAREYKGDHLATLLDSEGACNTKKGCGANPVTNEACTCDECKEKAINEAKPVENEASFRRVMSGLSEQMYKRFGYNVYITDVYNGFFIYSTEGYRDKAKLYKRQYSVNKEGEVELKDGEPIPVKYVQEYRTESGTFVGNCSNREPEMTKKQKIDQLITNGGWVEADRAWLEAQDDDKLNRLAVISKPQAPPIPTNNQEKPPALPLVNNQNPAPATGTLCPEDIEILNEAKVQRAAEKAGLIATINAAMANKPQSFTQEWLDVQPLNVLRAMASLHQQPQQVIVGAGQGNYRGKATVANVITPHQEPPLVPSDFGFDKK